MRKIAPLNGWKWNVEQLSRMISELGIGGYESSVNVIDDLSKLPPPVDGVITLTGGNWWIVTHLDLLGARLVFDGVVALHGFSSETCSITSTGLPLFSDLITGTSSNTIQNISITTGEQTGAVYFSAASPSDTLDWRSVNFVNCETIGWIEGYNNVIFQDGATINSANLRFAGTLGTVAFDSYFFSNPTGVLLEIVETTTVTRRFRINDSSFVVTSGNAGVAVSSEIFMPPEGYLLTNVNFSGGGTYTLGVDYKDNKALFRQCRGIRNSATLAYAILLDNSTATVITDVEVPVKVAGAFTLNPVSQRFDLVDNTLVYRGTSTLFFEISSFCALESSNNNVIRNYIALNGVVIPDSMNETTTNAGGRSESLSNRTVLELSEGDEVDLWTQNTSGANNVTVFVDSLLITPIP
jgi:hypothetical protein